MRVLALATTSIAWIVLAIVVVGWLVYALLNAGSARKESARRSSWPPTASRTTTTRRSRASGSTASSCTACCCSSSSSIGLPLYWVLEPGRQAGATEGLEKRLASWGAGLFAPTADGGFNCAGCHGGMTAAGGVAPYTVTDQVTQEVASVNWTAPALNTVLYRFDEDEVRYILTYGRPGSPMSAWGLEGGGPMNAQQIQSLIEYLKSIQIPRGELPARGGGSTRTARAVTCPPTIQADIETPARQLVEDGTYASYGEALFNLDLASGAYSCARCHTKGWSYGDPGVPGQGAVRVEPDRRQHDAPSSRAWRR